MKLAEAQIQEDEFSLAATDLNDNIDGEFEFSATNEGTYRFYTRAIDKANNEELIQTDSSKIAETIYAENFSGYAIILVICVNLRFRQLTYLSNEFRARCPHSGGHFFWECGHPARTCDCIWKIKLKHFKG